MQFAEFASLGEQPVRTLDLKRHLQGLCGQPRFRQRLVLPDGQVLPDDAQLDGPMDVQLILMPFSSPSREQVLEFRDAIVQSNPDLLEQVLQRPQDPNLEVGGRTPLHLAADCGSMDGVRLLLEAKADKYKVDNRGATPLSLAHSRGNAEILHLMDAKS